MPLSNLTTGGVAHFIPVMQSWACTLGRSQLQSTNYLKHSFTKNKNASYMIKFQLFTCAILSNRNNVDKMEMSNCWKVNSNSQMLWCLTLQIKPTNTLCLGNTTNILYYITSPNRLSGVLHRHSVYIGFIYKGEGKAIPLQAWTGL